MFIFFFKKIGGILSMSKAVTLNNTQKRRDKLNNYFFISSLIADVHVVVMLYRLLTHTNTAQQLFIPVIYPIKPVCFDEFNNNFDANCNAKISMDVKSVYYIIQFRISLLISLIDYITYFIMYMNCLRGISLLL